jgi:GNAT superfamily N-acetyltransferase
VEYVRLPKGGIVICDGITQAARVANAYRPNGLDLSYLLADPGDVPQIGPEKGRPRGPDGIARFRSEHGSFRYVLYEEGDPIAALQVVAPPPPKRGPWRATIANVYTRPERRREGLASALLAVAREDFDEVVHSADLSAEGAAWKASDPEGRSW